MQKTVHTLLLLFSLQILSAQTVDWSVKEERPSFVDAMLKTTSGKLLVAVAHQAEQSIYAQLYTLDGEQIWERKVMDKVGTRKIIELPDSRFLYFMHDGEVFVVDAEHENWEWLYDLADGEIDTNNNRITEIIFHQDKIRVFAIQNSNCLQIDINPSDLSLQSSERTDGTDCTVAAHFFEDGSSIEVTELGVLSKFDKEDALIWKNPEVVGRPYPESSPNFWNGRVTDLAVDEAENIYVSMKDVMDFVNTRGYGKIVRLNGTGDMMWEKLLGTDETYFSELEREGSIYKTEKIALLANGDLFVTGLESNGQTLVFKSSRFLMTPEGEIQDRVVESLGTQSFNQIPLITVLDDTKIVTGGIVTCPLVVSAAYWQCLNFRATSSVSLASSDIQIKLYPNPSNEYLFLDLQNENLLKDVNLIDLSGKVWKRFGKSRVVHIADMPVGMYFVEIQTSLGYKRLPWIKSN